PPVSTRTRRRTADVHQRRCHADRVHRPAVGRPGRRPCPPVASPRRARTGLTHPHGPARPWQLPRADKQPTHLTRVTHFRVSNTSIGRELTHDTFVERRQIVGAATGGHPLIGDHLLLDHFTTGVTDVGTQTGVGGHGAPTHHVRLHQHPRPVTD